MSTYVSKSCKSAKGAHFIPNTKEKLPLEPPKVKTFLASLNKSVWYADAAMPLNSRHI